MLSEPPRVTLSAPTAGTVTNSFAEAADDTTYRVVRYTMLSQRSPVGPELKQENRGETKHLLLGGCFAWHSKVETKQKTSFEFTFVSRETHA